MTHSEENPFLVLGLMSGTSLDGLDLALCSFEKKGKEWLYQIHSASTIPYSPDWKNRLSETEKGSALDFAFTHKEYGALLGEMANSFISEYKLKPNLISSHGHTIFHQPDKKLTFQIGDGAALAATARIPVVCDFRSTDVALGGQGAPLVPIGDELLFGQYRYCLNLGGFSNISYDGSNGRTAFDVSVCNMVLNFYAATLNLPYDAGGTTASRGKCNQELLQKLNSLDYYALPSPKSLGKEWVLIHFLPVLQSFDLPVEDMLRTLCEHISDQIAHACRHDERGMLLVTGGGAHNTFLIECIQKKVRHQVVVPDAATVDFKEALIFAFLGYLRYRGEINVLRSVTGSLSDHSAGSLYLAPC